MPEAKSGDTVRIHYTGRLTDGTQFDSSLGREPLEFTLGSHDIIPGLEREVLGMSVGEKNTVTIASEDAYGARNPAAVREIPRNSIPPEIEVEVGGRLQAVSEDGQPLMLTVVATSRETVTLDANHPLAGEDLVFEVELVEIVT